MIEWNDYLIGGIHIDWVFLWLVILFWFLASRIRFPEQRLKKDGPLEIHKRRYAFGEIDKEEYQEKKQLISLKSSRS